MNTSICRRGTQRRSPGTRASALGTPPDLTPRTCSPNSSCVSFITSCTKNWPPYFPASVRPSSKLTEPRERVLGTSDLYSQMFRSSGDHLPLQLLSQLGTVSSDGARTLWDPVLFSGKSIQSELTARWC